jgi:hypothetical protein
VSAILGFSLHLTWIMGTSIPCPQDERSECDVVGSSNQYDDCTSWCDDNVTGIGMWEDMRRRDFSKRHDDFRSTKF